MNEVLAKRMKRRRLRTKFKKYLSIIFVLALISSASLFAMFSYADENQKVKVVVDDSKDNKKEDDEKNKIDFDTLVVKGDMYLSDMTLDGFEMKTNKLKVETDKNVVLEKSEVQYIFQYCNLWEVEELDLSEVKLLDKEFRARTALPCKTIKKITLPDTITVLGDFVFYDWTNLQEINMPKELVEIGKATFSGCKKLKPLEWPIKLNKIGEQAFLECEAFEKIELPETIKYIGKFAFADCKNLKELVLPNNDELEIDGLIMGLSNTIISVYQGSKAYELLVPLNDKEVSYICKNKILVKPLGELNKLNKEPKVIEKNKYMNIGDNRTLDEFIDVDLQGTGAISYKVITSDDLSLLKQGNNVIEYKIKYYLSDVDISDINAEVNKVDNVDELYNLKIDTDRDSRFFVHANVVEKDYKIKIKVENYSSNLSSKVKELCEKYSKRLNAGKHKAYMTGFKDGSFRPKDSLTNAEVAAIIARLNDYDETKIYEHNYIDVNKSSWLSNYVGFVTEKNIMNGYYGMFRPNEKITRGEFIVAISKMINLEPVYNERSSFADVWYKTGEEYIVAFEKLEIIDGLPNGSFGYGKEVTRAEACKIINAALGRTLNKAKITDELKEKVDFTDVNDFNWFYPEVVEATIEHYEYEVH